MIHLCVRARCRSLPTDFFGQGIAIHMFSRMLLEDVVVELPYYFVSFALGRRHRNTDMICFDLSDVKR